MNWYIGQEIVCVKTHSLKLVKRGKTYTIRGLAKSQCNCGYVMIDVGISYNNIHPSGQQECSECGNAFFTNGLFWFNECLFAPLDQDISELTEILEQPIKQVQEI